MALKDNLQRLLKERRLSIAGLSKEVGLPKSNLTKWFNGANPNLEQLGKVADFFGISVDELAFDKKPVSSLEAIVNKLEIHTGLYEISLKKIVEKKK